MPYRAHLDGPCPPWRLLGPLMFSTTRRMCDTCGAIKVPLRTVRKGVR